MKWKKYLLLLLPLFLLASPAQADELNKSLLDGTTPVLKGQRQLTGDASKDNQKNQPKKSKFNVSKLRQDLAYLQDFNGKEDHTEEEVKKAQEAKKALSEATTAEEVEGLSDDELAQMRNVIADGNIKTAVATAKVEEAKEAKLDIVRAKNAKNPADMSLLTSYMYVEEGFFSVDDIFPKAVNALVQGIFFITKMVYILTMVILEAVFSVQVYEQLDNVVSFSASAFTIFQEKYQIYLAFILAFLMARSYFKYQKISMRLFSFVLVWFLAGFLYKTDGINVPNNYGARYNLSKVILAVDEVAQGTTKDTIQSFDSLESVSDNNNVTSSMFGGTGTSAIDGVRDSIFQKMVLDPFVAMNFDTHKAGFTSLEEAGQSKLLTDLVATKGQNKEVQDLAEKDAKEFELLNFGAIGSKFLIALSSVFKALVLGGALVVLGLISVAFKFLIFILIIAMVYILFVAMIPSMEYLLINSGKKIFQFVFLGGLGLFFIRAFLFINSALEAVASAFSQDYAWQTVIVVLLWLLLWKFRGQFSQLFTRGTLSAKELGGKVQSGLNQFLPAFSSGMMLNELWNRKGLDKTGSDSMTDRAIEDELGTSPNVSSEDMEKSLKSPSLLSRASKQYLGETFDALRFGTDEKAEERRENYENWKSNFRENVQHAKDVMVGATGLEKIRAGLHDYVGDEDAPVQQQYQERLNRMSDFRQKREGGNEEEQPAPNLQEEPLMKKQPVFEGRTEEQSTPLVDETVPMTEKREQMFKQPVTSDSPVPEKRSPKSEFRRSIENMSEPSGQMFEMPKDKINQLFED